MSKNSVYPVLGIVVLIGLFFQATSLHAQKDPRPAKIAIVSWENGPLQSKIKTALQEELKKSDWVKVVTNEEDPDFVFSFRTQAVRSADSNQIALGVVFAQSLPSPILEYCAKEEVPYKTVFASQKKKKLAKGGKFIREYVSKEMLKYFRNVLNLKVYTFPKSALQETCKTVAHDGLKAVSAVYKIKK